MKPLPLNEEKRTRRAWTTAASPLVGGVLRDFIASLPFRHRPSLAAVPPL